MNILIAEDDKNFGQVLKMELEEEGYVVDLVPDGVEAVLSFMNRAYDIVIFDIRMPKLNGIDALRIIKKFDPQVLSIMISGHARGGEIEEGLKAGAIKYFSKPFPVELLVHDIKVFIPQEKNIRTKGNWM